VTIPARVLVIEDSRLVGDVLRCALEQEGCSTVVAGTGQQGIELAQGLQPDLIMLDLGLGADIVATLAGDPATCDIPIIAISAPKRDLAGDYSDQVARVFGEPFYPAEVVAAALEALQRPARLGR
jgi:CheY-like chemotaxis protein